MSHDRPTPICIAAVLSFGADDASPWSAHGTGTRGSCCCWCYPCCLSSPSKHTFSTTPRLTDPQSGRNQTDPILDQMQGLLVQGWPPPVGIIGLHNRLAFNWRFVLLVQPPRSQVVYPPGSRDPPEFRVHGCGLPGSGRLPYLSCTWSCLASPLTLPHRQATHARPR
jgi:hypothetical protein